MSTRNMTRALPEVVSFRYRPQAPRAQCLILTVMYQGRTFPMKVDLKWAGSGIAHYSAEFGSFMLTRGRKGKAATEGETLWDGVRGYAGLFTATRQMAEHLISLLWGEQITLDGWPDDVLPRVTGATTTEEAITITLDVDAPLALPRIGTRMRLIWEYKSEDPIAKLVIRRHGQPRICLDVNTESDEGRAALTALGFLGYAPVEGVRPAPEFLNAAD